MTPHAREAERALLGGLITTPGALGAVLAIVQPDDLYSPDHAALLRLVAGMHRAGHVVDLVTVVDRIVAEGHPDRYGGVGYVAGLPECCPSTQALPHYARTVRDAAIRRRVADTADEIAARARRGDADVGPLLADAVRTLARASAGEETTHAFGDVLDSVVDSFQRVQEGRAAPALATGYRDLDRQLGGGLRNGELTILAARPAMGKTALAMNIAFMMALDGAPVGVFSLEMPRAQLVTRLIPMVSRVPLDRCVDARLLSTDDWEAVLDARQRVRDVPLLIDDTPALAVEVLAARARAMVARGARALFVDYLGKLKTEGRANPAQEVGRNVSALKDVARELEVPLVCLAQLNRGVEQRADKRPQMSDLRDSGEIEQEADSVMFVYRDHYYNPETGDPLGMDIIVSKARMGRLGTVGLTWHGPLQLVDDGPGLREVM